MEELKKRVNGGCGKMNEEIRYNYTGYKVYFDKKGKVHRYKEK